MRKNKILALIALLLIAILCLSSCGSSTPDVPETDIEGTNIKWKFTSSDNTLQIKGVGEIPDYTTADADTEIGRAAPWAEFMQSIEKVEVETGIKKIGNRAFYGAANLKAIELAETVEVIGDLAFAYTGLTDLDLSDNQILEIGYAAFEGCTALTSVDTSATLAKLGERAFAFCSGLKTVRIRSVVSIGSETFYNCNAIDAFYRHVDYKLEANADKVDAQAFRGTTFDFNGENVKDHSEKTVEVTVKFSYEDGSQNEFSTTDKGVEVGSNYNINLTHIEGYVLTFNGEEIATDSLVKTMEIKGEENITYEFVYKKIVEAEKETTADTVADTADNTDEEPDYLSLVIMIVVVVGVIVAGYFLIRSNKKEAEKAKNQNKAKNRKPSDKDEK